MGGRRRRLGHSGGGGGSQSHGTLIRSYLVGMGAYDAWVRFRAAAASQRTISSSQHTLLCVLCKTTDG